MLFGIKKLVIERAMKFDDFVLDIANFFLLIYFLAFGTIAVGGLPTPRNKHGYTISIDVGWRSVIVIGDTFGGLSIVEIVKKNAAIELVNAAETEFAKCAVIPCAITKQSNGNNCRRRCYGNSVPDVAAVYIERIQQNYGSNRDEAHEERAQHNHQK